MENYKQICQQVTDILDGKIKADGVLPEVETWLKVSCFHLAWGVANKTTKQERQSALNEVKQTCPLFYDDVSQIARMIFNEKTTN